MGQKWVLENFSMIVVDFVDISWWRFLFPFLITVPYHVWIVLNFSYNFWKMLLLLDADGMIMYKLWPLKIVVIRIRLQGGSFDVKLVFCAFLDIYVKHDFTFSKCIHIAVQYWNWSWAFLMRVSIMLGIGYIII